MSNDNRYSGASRSSSPAEARPPRLTSFATRRLTPSTAVISAVGELDASNAPDFLAYVLQHARPCKGLVLELTHLDFLGTEGFSSLLRIATWCAHDAVNWGLVPGDAVRRVLQICDPDATLPACSSVDSALKALQDGSGLVMHKRVGDDVAS